MQKLMGVLPHLFSFLVLGSASLLSSCAGRPLRAPTDPAGLALIRRACSRLEEVREVKGSVWMKAKSPEQSGQFPALVSLKWPSSLRLEITNLLGGAEALLELSGEKLRIQQKNSLVRREITGQWGGIPLRWAVALFSGRVPCPKGGGTEPQKVEWLSDSSFALNSVSEGRFEVSFRDWGGEPWVEKVIWRRAAGQVNFESNLKVEFMDPDPKDGFPKRWEAASDRGEVTVRWKDREVSKK